MDSSKSTFKAFKLAGPILVFVLLLTLIVSDTHLSNFRSLNFTSMPFVHSWKYWVANDTTNKTQPVGDKIVLLWTAFFSNNNWGDQANVDGSPVINIGNGQTCTLTRDRSLLSNASAVVFHGRNFNFNDLPSYRDRKQRWVFFLLESPHHSGFSDDAWQRASRIGFNWTMYYTLKSNVRFAYGYVNPIFRNASELLAVSKQIDQFAANFSSRHVDAIWIVSNCHPPSHREDLVSKLRQAGLNIDQFGACSGRSLEKELKATGQDSFFSRYRFQFALENSICDDYATEKLYNALRDSEKYGVIPVVFGGANYTSLFDSNSFIDLREPGATIDSLVSHMKMLSQSNNSAVVKEYLKWQLAWKVDERSFTVPAWHGFCRKLWLSSDNNSTISDIRESLGKCYD